MLKEFQATNPGLLNTLLFLLVGISPVGIVAVGAFLPVEAFLPELITDYIKGFTTMAMILSMVGVGVVWLLVAVVVWAFFFVSLAKLIMK